MIRPKFNFKNRLILCLFLIFILAVAALAFIYQDQLKLIYKSPETVKQYAAGFGAFAPVIFILSYVVQAFILFIPSSLLTISGGYIFGVVLGTVFSLIGVTIGSIIVFLIARKLGRPFFREIISKKELEHFDVFFKKRGDRSILLARSIPMLFPLDVVSVAAGLTQIKFKHYVIFSILGFIPNLFILALFGERLSQGINPATIIVLVLIILAIFGYILRHPLKVFLIREIEEYEKKLVTVEEKPIREIRRIRKEIKFEFHKWRKQLIFADKIFSILVVIFLGIFRPDYVMIAAYLLILPYLILTQRKVLFYHLLVASLVAIVWMLIAKDQYGYNHDFLTLFGINLFPLFGWAVVLFLVYAIYSHYEHILKEHSFFRQMLLFAAFYMPILIAFETLGYHAFDIRNVANAAFPGLIICDCIHAPRWMQSAYFAIGPIFFSLCAFFKLENPHFKKH